MVNRRRGEVPLELGGRRYTLCLTLGALADLEDSLRAGDLAGLAGRFGTGHPRTGDLIALLGAALRGGGHALSDEEVGRLPIGGGMGALVVALGEVLEAAFGAGPPENPPVPRGEESRA
ncbi:gene transfer agent family protein [Methylobacterium sp. J-076]|uniref:gene transfer agent family protein n=1 Tax=Methylobacterium sp. J-076 TaxID=2836655 RepID=UPI001FBB08D4|nr:gene transfer agent family protein [Methylobacterium sp. J-076]MCJ2011225.1 gene transfer agent family protein [Methylobacterium sp. J-076]